MAADRIKEQEILSLQKLLGLGNSILNGIVGDYLEQKGNGLAIPMHCFYQGHAVELTKERLTQSYERFSKKVCILVHGLTNRESIWDFPEQSGKNYGTLLNKQLGYTPFFVRYNTGLHISENGKRLADLIEKLVAVYPTDIDELLLIGHSMGGLVIRSGTYYGQKSQHRWTRSVKRIILIGSPHQGVPLEKLGHLTTTLLKQIPKAYVSTFGELIDVRSAGIKDLRHGYLCDEDWQKASSEPLKNNRHPVPLLAHAEHYTISGTLSESDAHWSENWLGDALVTTPSAHGNSKDPDHHIPFDSRHSAQFPGVGHLALAHSESVYQQIKSWCESV